ADVLFVPESVIANAPAEVVHHPFHVIDEGRDLSRRLGWPEDRVEAAIVIVKRARLRRDRVGQPTGGRRVHGVPVEELDLYFDAVVHQRVHVIIEPRRSRIDAALLLDPVPARWLRAVFILPDSDPAYSGVKHARPPPAVPGQVRITRQV